MTPDPSADPTAIQPEIRSTAGMTTKVVKGSIWTLIGQLVPLAASLTATPFVIRLLGAEGYGVLVLIGLIPAYLMFADFGMSTASTKFASEAYARGNPAEEASFVRTAALIAGLTYLPFGIAVFVFSANIMDVFNVPARWVSEASLAMKVGAAALLVNFLNNIVNTPQLTRLRMDLNTLVTAGFRTLSILLVPIVIYLGGGLVGALLVYFLTSLLMLAGHLAISYRLLGGFFGLSIDRSRIAILLKFGLPLIIAGVAAIVLINTERLVLTRVTSVETLAYYSVALTFSTLASMFSGAMIQSLIPAFSQLLALPTRESLDALFLRTLRLEFIALTPSLVFLAIVAKPVFTLWAGEEFGRESTIPFYVLVVGVFFNILAHVPYGLLVASGRGDLLAKLYWVEIVPYVTCVAILTTRYGAVGAAAAWSLRAFVDVIIMSALTKRSLGVPFDIFEGRRRFLPLLVLTSAPPILIRFLAGGHTGLLVLVSIVSVACYALVVWKTVLDKDEKAWLSERIDRYLFRMRL